MSDSTQLHGHIPAHMTNLPYVFCDTGLAWILVPAPEGSDLVCKPVTSTGIAYNIEITLPDGHRHRPIKIYTFKETFDDTTGKRLYVSTEIVNDGDDMLKGNKRGTVSLPDSIGF